MADLAERLTAEARVEDLTAQRDRAQALLVAVTRNQHDDSVTAGRLWRLLEKDTRRAIPVAELRALFDHDRGGRANATDPTSETRLALPGESHPDAPLVEHGTLLHSSQGGEEPTT